MNLSDAEKNLLHIQFMKKSIPLRKKYDLDNNKFYPELNESQRMFFHKNRVEEYAKEILNYQVQSFIEVFKQRKKSERIPEDSDLEQLLKELRLTVDALIRQFSEQHQNNIFSSLPDAIVESNIRVLSLELPSLITEATLLLYEFISLAKISENDVSLEENDEYEKALNIIKSAMLSQSRIPIEFKKNDENTFRGLLVHFLSVYYPGQVFAEAYNKRGKTDILIRNNKKNILIAECKIWGREKLNDTINQLLDYVSLYDEKAAIIIFSNYASFDEVLSKIEEEIKNHNNYISIMEKVDGTFKCWFRHPEDINRKLFLSVLAFNISEKEGLRRKRK